MMRPDLPYDQLTRQPTEGRARNGGLRVGEMERDVILSYGMAQFSKESAMDRSDKYRYGVCRHCGVVASPAQLKKSVYTCLGCKRNDISIIETPYAWKLMVQEFEALGVQMRFVTGDVEGAEEPDIMDEYEHAVVNEPDDEPAEEYEHNEDLNEPELYTIEEHEVMSGGSSTPDTYSDSDVDAFVDDDEPPAPVSVQEQATLQQPLQQPSQQPLQQPVVDAVKPQSLSVEGMAAAPVPPPVSPPSPVVPPPSPSGSSIDLDDSDMNIEDFGRQQIQPTQQGGQVETKPEIKVIEIGGNIPKMSYRPPRSDGDYSGETGTETETIGDDFF
ncbi:hypothetical protein EBT31_23245 [bacterium]|nr:hypothetical protein [bacterium]